ncbi:hypothetical protein ABPG77_004495 [Micractinium sp. CCAP 211/92]
MPSCLRGLVPAATLAHRLATSPRWVAAAGNYIFGVDQRRRMTVAPGRGTALGGAAAGPATERQQQQGQPPLLANPALAHSEVLLATTFPSKDRWVEYLQKAGLRVLAYPEDTEGPGADLSRVEFAICWNPAPGLLKRCPSLKGIQSMGAGVDHMIGEPSLPRHVPLLRVIDPLMSERMATWVLWGVINCQRKCDAYLAAQQQRRWDKGIEDFRSVDNGELRVGIMGLGVMGGATADALIKLGYPVSAWTRTSRQHRPGLRCYSGLEQLQEFASQVDVLVCLLPLTDATRGILDARLLSWLPRGASVINAARGGHLVEADLLAALDSGHVRRGGGPGAGWISGSFLAGSCVFVCSVVLLGGVVDIGSLLAQRNLLVVEGLGHWQRAALLRAGSCPQCACAVEMPPGHRLANLHAASWQMILPLTSPTSPPSPPACSLLLATQPFAAALLHTACIAAPLHLPLPPAARPPQLASAILDVFATEPLPADSPLWAHPRVRIFPHVSSMTNIESAVEQMLQNRECVLTGQAPPAELVVDWATGY